MTKNRTLASLISNDTSKIKTVYTDSDSIVTSASLGVTAAAGTTTYSSADTLPASADNGDQALVTSTNRLYIYSNGGWYNIALINSTPYWSTEASSSYDLNTNGTSTTITILAVDSEGINIVYTATADSDFNQLATITKDSDNGRIFIITPTDSENGTAVGGTGTVTFRASDGVNLVSTLSTFSLTFITIVANSAETTLLFKADTAGTDNQVDASTNSYTITENGNVTSTAFSPYHPGGYSTYFDGSGDYLTVTDSTDFDFGTGDFTMEGWYYATDVTGDRYLISFPTSTVNYHFGVNFYNGAWRVGLFNGSLITGTTGIETNVWHHFAWVRESGVMKFYIDGTQVGSNLSYSSALDCSSIFRIGTYAQNTNTGQFSGYIRDIRVVKGTAVYTSAFTPPTEPLTAIANTVLLACHAPYIADGSTNGHTITANGNAVTKRFGPFDHDPYTKAEFGGSVYFDGNGDYLTVGSASDGGLSGTFTIEFWMYFTIDYSTRVQTILTNYDAVSSQQWYVQQRNDGNFWLGSGIGYPLSYNLSPKINQWYHIAFSNDASSSTGKLFVNGIEVDDHTGDLYNSTHMAASTAPMTIGRLGTATNQDLGGYIADLRIIDGTMLYTSNFTPPTAPLTAITNTKLLTCTNKNDIWDAGSGNLLTKVGNTTASDTQRQFTTSSAVYFDGTSAVENIIDAIGNGDFTFEGWLNITADTAGNYQMVFDNRSTLSTGPMLFYYEVDDKLYPYLDGTAFTSNNAISQNTWYHWALVRNNNACTFYLNGTAQTSNAGTSITTNFTSTEFNIGRSSSVGSPANGDYFIGYQQDFRVTKGLARYTSNFTPPTAEFDG